MTEEFLSLPVYKHKAKILSALEQNQIIVVESPTGSGKTTQIPLILKEAGYDQKGIIGVTQPRRIATLSISDFIKRQLGIEDNYCGYTMRFADTTDESTRIKILTDGILLEELKSDSYLSKYSVIMVDEAHERSLNIDFILGLLKQITAVRKDLKIIISSATINTKTFSDFFDSAPVISIDARVYPIDIKYVEIKKEKEEIAPRRSDRRTLNSEGYPFQIASIIKERIKNKQQGDILVFLPGEADIKETHAELVKESAIFKKLQIYPLYSRLSKEEQERVFTATESGKTKVVLATNIAETSITINGISVVIDTGVAKVNYYNQRDFTSSLITTPISKSSAEQRAGRAGRTSPGVCYRLYTEKNLLARREYPEEEILHSDLAEVALRMSNLGIYDYERFPFITEPKKGSLSSAVDTLTFIGATDENHHLTSIGEKMVLFPLLPRHSRVIVEAIMNYPDVLSEVIIAVSFLSTKSPFLLPQGFEEVAKAKQSVFQDSVNGDFAGYLKLYKAFTKEAEKGSKAAEAFSKRYYLDLQTLYEIVHIATQLEEIISRMGIPISSGGMMGDYLTCLAAGLMQYVCVLDKNQSYRTLFAQNIYIHPGSSWFTTRPRFILAGEIVQTSRMFARSVSPLKKEYLDRINPDLTRQLLSGKTYAELKKPEGKDKKKANGEETLFGRRYPKIKYGKEEGAFIVPLTDIPFLIKKGYERGKVKKGVRIVLSYKKSLTRTSVALKDLIQEGSLLNLNSYKSDDFPSDYYDIASDGLEKLNTLLNYVFAFAEGNNNSLSFIALSLSKRSVGLKQTSSLTMAIDMTYAALKELRPLAKSKKLSKTRTRIDSLMSAIEDVEDFSEN